MKKLLLTNALFTFIAIVYYKSSFDLTNELVEFLYGILVFISPLTLCALIVQPFEFRGAVSKIFLVIALVVLVLYTWWTMFLGVKNYQDVEVLSIDPINDRHKVVRQYLDEGAIGGHSRTIKAFEILPGLRYVDSITY